MDEIKIKEMESLKKKNEILAQENIELKSRPKGRFGYIFLASGLILFSLALDFQSYIFAFFSLSFLFLGGIFLYISPNNYLKQEIIYSSLEEVESFYSDFIDALGYEGAPHYISPKTMAGLENVYAYIPKENVNLDHSVIETETNMINFDYIKIKPIGLGLSKLMEKEAKVNFGYLDIEHLFTLLRKMLIESFELVKNINIQKNDNDIKIRILYFNNNYKKYILKNTLKNNHMGGFIISSIACSIAKCTHKPIIIEEINNDRNKNIVNVSMKIL